jgi:hypothetical protein
MARSKLERGLSTIALCKGQTGDIWHAHFGAAAIAAWFFAQENDELPAEAAKAVIEQAEAMLERHALVREEGEGDKIALDEAERLIVDALSLTVDQLHWVGHNVIYAAHSLKALRALGGWGTRSDIEGIAALLRAFDRTIPGRSWIGYTASEVKRMELEAAVHGSGGPVIESADQLSAFVLGELAAFRTIYRAEAHHDLIGHLLTYSHALNILHDLGYRGLFRSGVPPLLKLAVVLRRSRGLAPGEPVKLVSPVDRLPLRESLRAAHLPLEHAYWLYDHAGHDWDGGHSFKFPAAFYDHLNRVPADGASAAAVENFRYLLLEP